MTDDVAPSPYAWAEHGEGRWNCMLGGRLVGWVMRSQNPGAPQPYWFSTPRIRAVHYCATLEEGRAAVERLHRAQAFRTGPIRVPPVPARLR